VNNPEIVRKIVEEVSKKVMKKGGKEILANLSDENKSDSEEEK